MKTCKKCGQPKPLDSFTVDVRYTDGRYPWCAECRRAWRKARRPRQNELQREWRERDTDHAHKYARDYYHEHRDKIAPKRRERDNKRWHSDAAHRERKNQQRRARYHTDPAVRKRRIGFALISANTRRARINGTNTRFTQAEWRELCAKYDHHCLCCGRQEPEIQLTPDHVRPLSRGGSNSIDNLQPLCLDCNLRKHARTIDYRPSKDGD